MRTSLGPALFRALCLDRTACIKRCWFRRIPLVAHITQKSSSASTAGMNHDRSEPPATLTPLDPRCSSSALNFISEIPARISAAVVDIVLYPRLALPRYANISYCDMAAYHAWYPVQYCRIYGRCLYSSRNLPWTSIQRYYCRESKGCTVQLVLRNPMAATRESSVILIRSPVVGHCGILSRMYWIRDFLICGRY